MPLPQWTSISKTDVLTTSRQQWFCHYYIGHTSVAADVTITARQEWLCHYYIGHIPIAADVTTTPKQKQLMSLVHGIHKAAGITTTARQTTTADDITTRERQQAQHFMSLTQCDKQQQLRSLLQPYNYSS